MAITPRCSVSASSSSSAIGSISPALTSWTNAGLGVSGTAPATGDLVVIIGTLNATTSTVSQTAGTGTWTFQDTGSSNGGASALETFVAWRVFDGTETAPTFTFSASGRNAYSMMAIAPTAGNVISVDNWATLKKDTVAATTHTANAATVTATFSDLSLILGGCVASANGTSALTFTAPTNWAIPTGASVSNTGGSVSRGFGTSLAWDNILTGTITPGAETMQGGSSSTGTTTANLYHLLVKEASVTVNGTATLTGLGDIGNADLIHDTPSVIQATVRCVGLGDLGNADLVHDTPAVIWVTATITGLGLLTGSGSVTVVRGTATCAGAGDVGNADLVHDTPVVIGAPATAAGAGTLTDKQFRASAAIAGLGDVGNADLVHDSPSVTQVTAAPAGAGSLQASVTVTYRGTALNGAGTLAAVSAVLAPATLAGAGAVAATGRQGAAVTGVAGAGSLAAVLATSAIASLAGAGSLAAPSAGTVPAALAGAGALTAVATQVATAAAAGKGGEVALATQLAQAQLTGAGTITAAASVTGPVTLLNDFEEGTAGNSITAGNSGGPGESQFDVVFGNGYTSYSNLHAAHGSLSCESFSFTLGTGYVQWSTSAGSHAKVWWREYLYLPAVLTDDVLLELNTAGSGSGAVRVTGGGTLYFATDVNGVVLTGTAPLPAQQWFRIEGYWDNLLGQVELKLFTSMDSITATETLTSGTGNSISGGQPIAWLFPGGKLLSRSSSFIYADDVGVSSSGYLGPAATLPVVGTGTLAGSGQLAALAIQQATASLAALGSLTAPVTSLAPATLAGTGAAGVVVTEAAVAALTGRGVLTASGHAAAAASPGQAATVDTPAGAAALHNSAAVAAAASLPAGSAVTRDGSAHAAVSNRRL